MDKKVIDIGYKKNAKCEVCSKGCPRDDLMSDMCLEEIGLDLESIAKRSFDSNQTAYEMYKELKTMEEVSQGGKFRIGNHLRALRATQKNRDLDKMLEYLEQKSLFKNRTNGEPVQLMIVDEDSPRYKNAKLLICADCAVFIYADLHEKFIEEDDSQVILFCPRKQNAKDEYIDKLAYMFENNNIKSIFVLQTETECCSQTVNIVKKALAKAKKIIPWDGLTISISGEVMKKGG